MNQNFLSYSSPNLGRYEHEQLQKLVFKLSQKCKCGKDMIYKCLEKECGQAHLICPNCDVFQINGGHFNHYFTYVLPLFKDVREINFKIIKEKAEEYLNILYEVQENLYQYLNSIRNMISIAVAKVDRIDEIFETHGLAKLLKRMQNIQQYNNLNDILQGVIPIPLQQYQQTLNDIINPAKINNTSSIYLQSKHGEEMSRLIQKWIQQATNIQDCKFSIPFITLNKQRLNSMDMYLDFELQNLYTDKFAYANVELDLMEANNFRQIFLELAKIRNSRKIKIFERNNKMLDFVAGWAQPIKGKIRFQKIAKLQIDGQQQFIKGILQSLFSKGEIETLVLKPPKLFINTQLLHNNFKILELKIISNTQLKQDPYFSFVEFCFTNKYINSFSLTYRENIKQGYYWSEFQINSLKEHLKKSRKKLFSINLNAVQWQDPSIILLLMNCQCLLQFSLVLAPSQNLKIINPEIDLDKYRKNLKNMCIMRKRALYTISKQCKVKVFKNKVAFNNFYSKFLLK